MFFQGSLCIFITFHQSFFIHVLLSLQTGERLNPEKEIITWWLHKQGFFTITSIKAPRNREVDILAIKIDQGTVQSVWHVESAISVSSLDNAKPSEYKQRFDDLSVRKKVKESIKKHLGKAADYEKVLIVGSTSTLGAFKRLEGITVREFGDVLCDVLASMDKRNYRNITLRTLQLTKFLALSEPKRLAALLSEATDSRILKLGTREKFIRYLLQDAENLRILAKPDFEDTIIRVLASSSLKNPQTLARIIHNNVLSNKSRKRFLESILELNNMQVDEDLKRKLESPRDKPLQEYM